MKDEIQILSRVTVNTNLLPVSVLSETADRFITVKVVRILGPTIEIGSAEVFRATVLLFFQGRLMTPVHICVSKGYLKSWKVSLLVLK